MFFRGREIVHQAIGRALLDRLDQELAEVGTVENRAKMEGPNLIAIISPKKIVRAERRIMKMKLKTHRGAAKRFKVTGSGKVMRHHAFARHILTSKAAGPEAASRQVGSCQRRRHANSAQDASLRVN